MNSSLTGVIRQFNTNWVMKYVLLVLYLSPPLCQALLARLLCLYLEKPPVVMRFTNVAI
jgi:hypothetical protein